MIDVTNESNLTEGKNYGKVSTIKELIDDMWPTDTIVVKDKNGDYHDIVNCVADYSNGYVYLYIDD